MKSQKVLRRIKAKLGSDWPTCKPVPNELIAELCDVLWEEGGSPSGARLVKLLHLNPRAVFPGINAWREQVDLSPDDLQTEVGLEKNKAYLAKLVSPLMAAAPQTCLDSLNDGRWQIPTAKVLAYLGRIRNESVRESMILAALVGQSTPVALYGGITTFTSCVRVLMADLAVTRIGAIDPHEMIPKLYRREIGKNFSDHLRVRLVKVWNQISRSFEEYAARLSDTEVEQLSRFFIQPVTNQRRLRQYSLLPEVLETQQATVKAKTDIVYARFHQLRHIAKMRLNQARRLKEATTDTIAHVTSNNLPLPHRFSYEELVTTESGRKFRQRVHLSLWDSRSIFNEVWRLWPTRDGTSKRARERRLVRVSPEYLSYEVEYRGVESLEPGVAARPFWFIGFYENFLFTVSGDPTLIARQQSFNKQWGYRTNRPWVCSSRLIGSSTSPNARDLTWLQKEHGHVFIPYEGILATCLFASLLIELQTKTGARLGEVQQIAQNPECIKQLTNVGPKAATRWLLRMVPKGHKDRGDYFIDNETKDQLMEVVRYLRTRYGTKKLPVVRLDPGKAPPDSYIFQWNNRCLTQGVLNHAIRFLLHGSITTAAGQGLHLTTHLLRHAFATEMANLQVPVEVLATILHQRDLKVTRYYSRPTRTQLLDASEMIFVDRIDVAAEVRRSPNEIGQMLKEAEGKIGALTEVIGGTCVISNFCPAKFACVGCAGNAPDPSKRHQVERKLSWAKQQSQWAAKETLYAEERQMNHLVEDCGLMLQEMDLIEHARTDRTQTIVLNHGRKEDPQ